MEFRKRLGSGGFAEVYEGSYVRITVAIKKMKPSTKNPTATNEAFEAEAALPPLDHPHVIKIFAAIYQPEPLLIMELVPDAKTLQTLIDHEATYDWKHYARQLVSALTYLHHRYILHLDIKPANVLLTQQNICKLGDFGCSQYALTPTISQLQGTLQYRAPELLRGLLPSTKADIYSLGITLWSLKTRQQPYEGLNHFIIAYQVVSQHLRPTEDSEFVNLWHADPERRPDAYNISL